MSNLPNRKQALIAVAVAAALTWYPLAIVAFGYSAMIVFWVRFMYRVLVTEHRKHKAHMAALEAQGQRLLAQQQDLEALIEAQRREHDEQDAGREAERGTR